jgi:hydroxymethylbilane synthase
MKSAFRIGTRRSALAQTQTRLVVEWLSKAHPDIPLEVRLYTTTGDKNIKDIPATPRSGGLKAQFTKELEEALLAKEIDFAVHSMKDLPGELPTGLVIAAVPRRDDARDAWISASKTAFADLPHGARVGTGSVRRQAQLARSRPDLKIVGLRGNVDTRLKKLGEGKFDGLILAAAGLKLLAPELCLPAVGQGCLAIECRAGDQRARDFLAVLNDDRSFQAAAAERAFLAALGGSCQTPIAAHAVVRGDQLLLRGLVIDPRGAPVFEGEESGAADTAVAIGARLGRRLWEAGAKALLAI